MTQAENYQIQRIDDGYQVQLSSGRKANCKTEAEAKAISESKCLFRETIGKKLTEDKLRQVDFTARTLRRYVGLTRCARGLFYRLADHGWTTPIHILQ